MKIIHFILLIIMFLLNPFTAQAVEIQSANEHLTVMPAEFELRGNRGDKLTQALRITNEDNEDAIIALSVEGFTISGENGEVVLSDYHQATNLLSRWLTFEEKGLQLKAKQTKIIKYAIDIPKEAPMGGHYASIVLSMDRLNKSSNTPTGTVKIMSLVLLSVSGDIIDGAQVKSFGIDVNDQKPIDLTLRVKNTGNDHIRPRGALVISNIWGNKIDEIPLSQETILPGVTRKIISEWMPQKVLAGRYTAAIVATYGHDLDKKFSSAATFWVLPAWFIIVVILVIALIIIVIKNLRGKFNLKSLYSLFKSSNRQ